MMVTSSLLAEPTTADEIAATQPAKTKPPLKLIRWWQSIGWGVFLLVILTASAGAIIVFSRRFRAFLTRQAGPPTPSNDVWSMHKLPDEADANHRRDQDDGADDDGA